MKISFLFFWVCMCAISVNAQVAVNKMDVVIPHNSSELNSHALGMLNAMTGGDFNAMKSHMHEDFMVYGVRGDSLKREGYIDLWKSYHEGSTDIKISEAGVFAVHFNDKEMEGDAVLFYGLAQWTPKGSSRPIFSWTHQFMHFKDGKVWKIYNFQDQLPILMQAGYTVSPPAANK